MEVDIVHFFCDEMKLRQSSWKWVLSRKNVDDTAGVSKTLFEKKDLCDLETHPVWYKEKYLILF